MRSKEDAHDYRYFPEPDLPPVIIASKIAEAIKKSLPELPDAKRKRMIEKYKLTEQEADILIEEKFVADFYEETVQLSNEPKEASNWIITEVLRVLKTEKEIPLTAKQLSDLILAIKKGIISRTAGKEVFEELILSEVTVEKVIAEKGFQQISATDAIEAIVEQVLSSNPQAIEDFAAGKTQYFGFLMGQCMKASKGKGNPGVVKEILEQKLKE